MPQPLNVNRSLLNRTEAQRPAASIDDSEDIFADDTMKAMLNDTHVGFLLFENLSIDLEFDF